MYSLQELAEESGVEARTIRSYIEKGLLPGAEARGPKSFYTAAHLDRLQVIQLLRQANPSVALQDIRLVLHQLTPQQVEDLARGRIQIGGLLQIPEREKPPGSALEYLTAFRQLHLPSLAAPQRDQQRPRDQRRRVTEQDQTAVEQLAEALRALAGASPTPGSARRQTWCRFEVTPDIELQVRSGFSEEQLARFQRIADLLRHVLTRGTKGRNPPQQ